MDGGVHTYTVIPINFKVSNILNQSGAPSTTSHLDRYILSNFYYLGSPLG